MAYLLDGGVLEGLGEEAEGLEGVVGLVGVGEIEGHFEFEYKRLLIINKE